MWHWNPFGHLTENGDTLHVRTLRTSLWQKTVDTFNVFFGRDFYSARTHYDATTDTRSVHFMFVNQALPQPSKRAGLVDYATLFIPKLCIHGLITFFQFLVTQGPAARIIGGVALIPLGIITGITTFVHFIMATTLTFISLLFIAPTHWISSIKGNTIKQAILDEGQANAPAKHLTKLNSLSLKFDSELPPILSEVKKIKRQLWELEIYDFGYRTNPTTRKISNLISNAKSLVASINKNSPEALAKLNSLSQWLDNILGRTDYLDNYPRQSEKLIALLTNAINTLTLLDTHLSRPADMNNLLNNESYIVNRIEFANDDTEDFFCKVTFTARESMTDMIFNKIVYIHPITLIFENDYAGHRSFLKFISSELNLGGIKNSELPNLTLATAKSEAYTASYIMTQLTREGEAFDGLPREIMMEITKCAPSKQSILNEEEKKELQQHITGLKFFKRPTEDTTTADTTSKRKRRSPHKPSIATI